MTKRSNIWQQVAEVSSKREQYVRRNFLLGQKYFDYISPNN